MYRFSQGILCYVKSANDMKQGDVSESNKTDAGT